MSGTAAGAAAILAIMAMVGCAEPAPHGLPDGGPAQSAVPSAASTTAPASAPAAKAEPAAGPAQVTLQSTVLGEQRTILVRTPPGYERGTDRHPVLYLTDGDRQIAHTAATIEYLAGHGRMPEMIVMGITNTDRTRDLTPTKSSMKDGGRVMEMPTSGGADKFLEFIEKELVPHVEKSYRTQPYRVFAGHSFGGLFAVHALTQKPDLFQGVIAVAPSLQWDNGWVLKRAEQLLTSRPELDRTLFVTLGDEPGEAFAAFEQLQKIAAQKAPKGFRFGAAHMPDEDHGSVVLRSHYAGFRKVFDGWMMPRDPETQAVAKGIEAVDAHYAALSKRFGFDVRPPEELLNQLGYQLMQGSKLDDAIAVFQRNAERYPASANVYDSLADAYENKGQLDLAVTNYAKASKVAEESGQPNLDVFKKNLERVTSKQKESPAPPK
ncbi:MAG: alpha/beta hydrolase-fold protein [Polyangiaceae bacterium]